MPIHLPHNPLKPNSSSISQLVNNVVAKTISHKLYCLITTIPISKIRSTKSIDFIILRYHIKLLKEKTGTIKREKNSEIISSTRMGQRKSPKEIKNSRRNFHDVAKD